MRTIFDLKVPESRWGPADQAGAANEVTSEVVADALRLATGRQILDLSYTIAPDAPRLPALSPYTLCMWSHPSVSRHLFEEGGIRNGIGFADERVEMDLHTGTHIDALGHVCIGDYNYNRIPVVDAAGNFGLEKAGIEQLPPLVTRGILLDIALYRGSDLEAGEAVTPADLEGAVRHHGVAIRPGDIVLIRTGWGRYYGTDNDVYVGPAPGIDVAAAEWLTERRVVAIGADTMLLEVFPYDPVEPFNSQEVHSPVHQHLLVKCGTYIIENAKLDEIAAAGSYEFLCMCLAPKFRGGTGSPVRLAALL
jgi:kynurenine formamidase